jgi:hypothetical protein
MKLSNLKLKLAVVLIAISAYMQKQNNSHIDEQYSPSTCTVLNYYFTFLYDTDVSRYKIHGLWANECDECQSCGYPTCCSYQRLTYEYPNEFDDFIKTCWFNSTADGTCITNEKVILFEHEFFKHGSCLQINTTLDYVQLVETLYSSFYQQYVYNQCNNSEQLWLGLDKNMSYVQTKCLTR